jgi:hypothetical protein
VAKEELEPGRTQTEVEKLCALAFDDYPLSILNGLEAGASVSDLLSLFSLSRTHTHTHSPWVCM